jgi:hypothetical protein
VGDRARGEADRRAREDRRAADAGDDIRRAATEEDARRLQEDYRREQLEVGRHRGHVSGFRAYSTMPEGEKCHRVHADAEGSKGLNHKSFLHPKFRTK